MLALWNRSVAYYLIASLKGNLKETCPINSSLSISAREIPKKIRDSKWAVPTLILEASLSLYVALPLLLRRNFFYIVYESLLKYQASRPSNSLRSSTGIHVGDFLLDLTSSTRVENFKLFVLSLDVFEYPPRIYFHLYQKFIPFWFGKTQDGDLSLPNRYRLQLLQIIFTKRKKVPFGHFIDQDTYSIILNFLASILSSQKNLQHTYEALKLLVLVLEFGFRNLKGKFQFTLFFKQFIPFLISLLLEFTALSTAFREGSPYLPKLLDVLAMCFDFAPECKTSFIDRTLGLAKNSFMKCVDVMVGETLSTSGEIKKPTSSFALLSSKASKFIHHFLGSISISFKSTLMDENFYIAHLKLFLHYFVCDSVEHNRWSIYHYDACVQILHQLLSFSKNCPDYSVWIDRLHQTIYEPVFQRLILACILPVHLSRQSDTRSDFIQIQLTESHKIPEKPKTFLKQDAAFLLKAFLRSSRSVSNYLLLHLSKLLLSTYEVIRSSTNLNMIIAFSRLWSLLFQMPLVRKNLFPIDLEIFTKLFPSLLENVSFTESQFGGTYLLQILNGITVDKSFFSYLSTLLPERIVQSFLKQKHSKIATNCYLNSLSVFLKSSACQKTLLDYVSKLIPWLYTMDSSPSVEYFFVSNWFKGAAEPFEVLYFLCFEWLWKEELNENYLLGMIHPDMIPENHWACLFLKPPEYSFFDRLNVKEKALSYSITALLWLPSPEFRVPFYPLLQSRSPLQYIYVTSTEQPELKVKLCKNDWIQMSEVFRVMFTEEWLESYTLAAKLEFDKVELFEDVQTFRMQGSSIHIWWVKHQFSMAEGFHRILSLLRFLHQYLCSPLFLHVFQCLLQLLTPKHLEFQTIYAFLKKRNARYADKRIFLADFYQSLFQPGIVSFSKQWRVHHALCLDAWNHRLTLAYVWLTDTDFPEKTDLEHSIQAYILKAIRNGKT